MKLKTSDLFIRLRTLRITLQDLVFCPDLYREAGFCLYRLSTASCLRERNRRRLLESQGQQESRGGSVCNVSNYKFLRITCVFIGHQSLRCGIVRRANIVSRARREKVRKKSKELSVARAFPITRRTGITRRRIGKFRTRLSGKNEGSLTSKPSSSSSSSSFSPSKLSSCS